MRYIDLDNQIGRRVALGIVNDIPSRFGGMGDVIAFIGFHALRVWASA
jgi:hypothetical protein